MAGTVGTMRKRIEAQGFTALTDDQISQFNFWLRLAPAICLAWTAFGVVLASPVILGALVPFAVLGAVLRTHPFDVIYNHGFRHLKSLPELPEYGRPRRFACLMASVMVTTTAVLFGLGWPLGGYLAGGTMLTMATITVTTNFCVPSAIYRLATRPSGYTADRGGGANGNRS